MEFYSQQWLPVLTAAGLADFFSVWALPLEPVDNPNRARGGWSEVCFYQLPEPVAGVTGVYIKRQQDFAFFDWKKPFKGLPTFQREYNNLVWCLDHDLPVVRPVSFSVRDCEGHRQAILITQALNEYFSLDDGEVVGGLSVGLRRKIIKAVAIAVKRLHENNLQHGCLYPKHIFVNKSCQQGRAVDICFIDLEKASLFSFWNKGMFRDLDTLNRRAYGWSQGDRYCFLKQYCGGDREMMRKLIARLGA